MTEACFENWKRIEPVSFFFDPDINEVTITNEYYEIKPMINPFQVKYLVDVVTILFLLYQRFLRKALINVNLILPSLT